MAPVLARLHKLGLLTTLFIILQTVDKIICSRGYVGTQRNYIYRTLRTNNSVTVCPFSSYIPISPHGAPLHSIFFPPLL